MNKVKILFWWHKDLIVDNYDNEQEFEVDITVFARIPVKGETILCEYLGQKLILVVGEIWHRIGKKKDESSIEISCSQI